MVASTTLRREAVAALGFIEPEGRPQTQLYLGFQLAEQGGTEGAIRAFRSALAATLDSDEPEDLRMRRAAAAELVRLLRESADDRSSAG